MNITPAIEQMVATIDEHKTALDATILMAEKNIGSVVVTSASEVKGLFTERALMKKIVAAKKDPATTKLEDVALTAVIKISTKETCERSLELMEKNQCRHLLVFEGDEFVGLISLRDLVSLMIKEKESLITQLEQYIVS